MWSEKSKRELVLLGCRYFKVLRAKKGIKKTTNIIKKFHFSKKKGSIYKEDQFLNECA